MILHSMEEDMGNIIGTVIIIYDTYKNVLVIQRGKKATGEWALVGKEIKGKETPEKCITKAVEKDLDCTVFELKEIGSYPISEGNEDEFLVYSGMIKQNIVTHKTINNAAWIGKKDILKYNLEEECKRILEDFFK